MPAVASQSTQNPKKEDDEEEEGEPKPSGTKDADADRLTQATLPMPLQQAAYPTMIKTYTNEKKKKVSSKTNDVADVQDATANVTD